MRDGAGGRGREVGCAMVLGKLPVPGSPTNSIMGEGGRVRDGAG